MLLSRIGGLSLTDLSVHCQSEIAPAHSRQNDDDIWDNRRSKRPVKNYMVSTVHSAHLTRKEQWSSARETNITWNAFYFPRFQACSII